MANVVAHHDELLTQWPNFSEKWTFAVIIQVGFSYFILNRDQNLNLTANLNLEFMQIVG